MDDKKEAAAPAAGDAGAHATPKGKKSSLVKFLIIGVVLGGAGLGAALTLGKKSHAPEPEKAADPGSAGEKKKTQVVTLKPIVVNLRNSKGTRYLKVTVGMETASEDVSKELLTLSPQITDFLVEKLSNVEVSDVDNSAGRNRLKREILSGTNELLESGFVNTVYFTEFMIQ
jgi:flagellar FliL protein